MDRRERYVDQIEAMHATLDDRQAQIWTAMPGIIVSFNAGKVTASVQGAIKGQVRGEDGKTKAINLPLLVDVPVVFQHGGGYSLTFPVAKGDECLVVFGSRCIDGWWQRGGVQPALDQRMHDLSDAFAIVGPYSQAHLISGISTAGVQLRSDDGATVVEVVAGHVTLRAASVTIDTPMATFTGAIQAVGDIKAATISLEHHVHGTGPQPTP